ncbi:hypothetical protein AAKU61_003835 [Undibacterium sp. GrIS 1.2]
MDHIECPHCHKQGTPNIWHYQPFMLRSFRYMKTQHICRFCGAVMYETGGQVRILGWVFLAFLAYLFGRLALQFLLPNADWASTGLVSPFFKAVSLWLVGYGIYKIVKFVRSKLR